MAEADIYINTADEEAYKPDTLALSKLLVDVGSYTGKRKRHEQGLRGWWTRSMVSSNSNRIIQSFGFKAGQQVC